MSQSSVLLDHSFVAPINKNRESLSKLQKLFKNHEKMVENLFELLVYAGGNKFIINDSLYKPCEKIIKSLKDSYQIYQHSFDKDDINICLKILKKWIEEYKAPNIMTFFSGILTEDEFEEALKDFNEIKNNCRYEGASLKVRKLVYRIIKIAGFLNFDNFEGKEIRSIIKSVQGSVKCANSWAENYKTQTIKLENDIKTFRACVKSEIIVFMEGLVEERLIVKLKRDRIKTILTMISNTDTYEIFKNKIKHGWVPSEKIYNRFNNNSNIFKNQPLVIMLGDNEDSLQEVSIFEYLNIYHKKNTRAEYTGITPFTKNDGRTKIALGYNYIPLTNISILSDNNTNYLEVKFKCTTDYSLYFAIGDTEAKYQNNYKIVKIKNDMYEVIRTIRRFDVATNKEIFTEITGILNEPEISKNDGVFSIHLPINWKVDNDSHNLQIFGHIKSKKSIEFPTTPFAKSFKDKISKIKQIDSIQNLLALDLGWDPMIGVYTNVNMPQGTKLVEIFKNNIIREKQYYCFSQYCRDKNQIVGNTYYEDMKTFDMDYGELRGLISYAKSLMNFLYAVYRKDDTSKNKWALEGFDKFLTIINSFDESFFNSKMNKNVLINLLTNINKFEGDIKSFKLGFIIPIYKFVSKIFKAHKDFRKTTYNNNHQFDMKWLKAIDEFIMLLTKTSKIGFSPNEVEINIDSLVEYRNNVENQFEKEVSCFVRDTALSYSAKLVFVEKLKPENYITEDSAQNRMRSLFAPSRMKSSILNALTQSDIIMAEVDENMTSRVVKGELGLRSLKSGWKNIHTVRDGKIITTNADENACDNIFIRGVTLGAARVKFNLKIVEDVKKIGNISKLALIMHCIDDIKKSKYSHILHNNEISLNEYQDLHDSLILPKIRKDTLKTNICYFIGGEFIDTEEYKKRIGVLTATYNATQAT